MWPFRKSLENLKEADLEALIGVQENQFLEFKETMYPRKDPRTRLEIARDVSAMANAEGAVIVVGMAADAEERATKLVPVPDAEAEATRLVQICDTAVDGRIVGLRTQPIAIAGGAAFVVAIPKSYRKPHLVVVGEPYELWIRRDRRRSPMSVAEIRDAVLGTEDLVSKVERFIEARRKVIRDQRTGVTLGLTATPLVLEEGRFAVPDKQLMVLLQNPPVVRPNVSGGTLVVAGSTVRPSINGLRVTAGVKRLEVFRNGHVEFALNEGDVLTRGEHPKVLTNWVVVDSLMNLALLVRALRIVLKVSDPYLFTLLLLECRGIAMHSSVNDGWGAWGATEYSEGDDLLLGPVLALADEDPAGVSRTISDQLWNAFESLQCPYFDAEGNFQLQ